jgi:hypothetical protein
MAHLQLRRDPRPSQRFQAITAIHRMINRPFVFQSQFPRHLQSSSGRKILSTPISDAFAASDLTDATAIA